MKRTVRGLLLACLIVAMSAGAAMASGFGIYEWSGRGNAMGGAVAATPKDASAIAYNPAGMTDVEGTSTVVGVSAINPLSDMEFREYDNASGKSNVWLPPHAYLSHQLTDRWWIGAGVFSRYGLGTEWESDWPGRYNVVEASIQSLSFNPNLAYRLNDKWSFSVGAEVMKFEFLQRKVVDHTFGSAALTTGGKNNPDTFETDTDAKLLGDSIGVGLTLGVYHKPVDWMRVGLSYRSQIEQRIIGDATFSKTGSQQAAIAGAYATDVGAEGELILPDSVTFALSVDPIDKLTLEGDLIWTRWSTYQELRIQYDEPLVPGNANSAESTSVKNWADTWRVALGAEYALYDWLDLRCGYVYDQSPVQDENADYMLPTNDREIYSAGVGIAWDQWTFDLSYMYLTSKNRNYADSHTDDGILAGNSNGLHTHIGGFSVGYMF